MNSNNGYFIEEDENGFGKCLVLTGPWHDNYAHFMSMNGVTVLRLSSSAGWGGDDISFVADLKFLSGVEVFSWSVKDVTPIFQNLSLRYVGLQCHSSAKAEFQFLRDLEVCKIFWSPGISGLGSRSKLKHLNIVDYPYDDLTSFISLNKLERLQIVSKKLVSLLGIESMAQLRVFDAANCQKLSDISSLVHCSNLQALEFNGCRHISQIPSGIALGQLKIACFIDCGRIKSLAPLANCKNLRELKFTGDTYISDGNLDFLLTHVSVRDVWFANRSHYSLQREQLAEQLKLKS